MHRIDRPQTLKPAPSEAESLARQAYDACHPDDSFEDLKRRAHFSRHDAGLLDAWTEATQARGLGPAKAAVPNWPADKLDARPA